MMLVAGRVRHGQRRRDKSDDSQGVVFGLPSVERKFAICAANKVVALLVGAEIPTGFHHLRDQTVSFPLKGGGQ